MKYHILLCFTFLACLALPVRAGDHSRRVTAVRITKAPVIDGILSEAEWRLAQPATDFTQRDPEEGSPASERTEIHVLYDDEALYFGCMFYDTNPAGIVSRLTRRDDEVESDRGSIRIDAYHDHQTGYEFTFNVAGVKVDILQYDDATREDESWDPVWDLQTRINAEGWVAEIKIPFSIIRYRANDTDTVSNEWGINFIRYITRKQETDRWAFTLKSESGFISRFGHLDGLRNLPRPRPLELLPFIQAKQQWSPATDVQDRFERFSMNAGLDLKYGLSNNFTIDATVNPDFGQVEADPAVLNLSTFETFYPEQRPFFVEGTQILRFSTFADEDNAGPGLFYSRRIGRAISVDEVTVPDKGRIEEIPQHTAILGAAKLSGKTEGGLSVGILQAVTRKEVATVVDSAGHRTEQILDPLAHYNVIRLKQDVADGSSVGMIFTSVEKKSRSPAFSGGGDWNLKFEKGLYQLDGFLGMSHTTDIDTSRITGGAGRVQLARVAAVHWLWSASGDFTSKHYNVNDVGYFRRPDDFGGIASVTYKEDVPSDGVRSYRTGLTVHERWNFDGANLFRQAQWSGMVLFSNYWQVDGTIGADAGMYDDRETRGNGLYRKPVNYSTGVTVETDRTANVIFQISQSFGWDSKRKTQASSQVEIEIRPVSWMQWEVEGEYQTVRNQEAWLENVELDGATASIFADRSTREVSFTLRGILTFTRDLTLQLYGQIFLAKGQYENYRRLIDPSTFESFAYERNPDFNVQALNTNVVLRWEYLPGSTLFFVWSQARNGGNDVYSRTLGQDLSETFVAPPSNVLLLKMTYWWNR